MFGLGTIVSTTFFSRHKKKLIFGAVALVSIVVIYGGMKWDAWRIEGLKSDLQKERQANTQNTETIQEQTRLTQIDEEALTELLDTRDAIRRETDDRIEKVISDVRLILENDRQISSEQMASLDRRLDDIPESTVSERVVEKTSVREVDRPVNRRVAERLADGMWDAYCRGVSDDRLCPKRQSPQTSGGGDSAQ